MSGLVQRVPKDGYVKITNKFTGEEIFITRASKPNYIKITCEKDLYAISRNTVSSNVFNRPGGDEHSSDDSAI